MNRTTGVFLTAAKLLVTPAMLLAPLTLAGQAAAWAHLEPRFIEVAASALSDLTGLPHLVSVGIVVLVMGFAVWQILRALAAIIRTPTPRV
jgi:hypothetical protein